jgi:hypothetical protein
VPFLESLTDKFALRALKNFYAHKTLQSYSDFQSLLGGDIK